MVKLRSKLINDIKTNQVCVKTCSAAGRVENWFNPFTAPACKIAGLKYARTRLQTVFFPVL